MKNLYTNSAVFYDAIYPSSQFHDDIDFFKNIIQRSSSILELGCGTGRVTTALSMHCKDVHAVDLSIEMLNVLTKKIESNTIDNIIMHNENMKNFTIDKKFNLIIFPFNSFQSLTTIEDQIQCLTNCKTMLSHDGLLIINIFNPNIDFLNNFSSFRALDYQGTIGDNHIKRESIGLQHCPESQTITGQYSFTVQNKANICNFVDDYELGYLYPSQLLKIIKDIGFNIAFQHEDWSGNEFSQNSHQYILAVEI